MHHLKGIDYDKNKVSGTILIEGFPGEVRYVASKVTEVYTFITEIGKERVGYIYLRENNQRKEGSGDMTVLDVSGAIPRKWLLIADPNTHQEVNYTVEQDAKAIGSVQKPTGLKWREEIITTGNFDVTRFIYTPVSEEKIRRERDLSWLASKDYNIYTTKEEIDNYIELLKGLPKETYIGLDSETTGLRVNKNKVDEAVGISISHKVDFGVYIPFRQKYGKNSEYSMKEVMEKLRPIIDKREDTAKQIVLHNAKFDWKVFKQSDIELNIAKDTFIMMGLMRYARGKMYGLDEFVEHYHKFGYDKDVLHDVYYKNQIQAGHKEQKSLTPLNELPNISSQRSNGLKESIEHYFNYDVIDLTDMFQKKTPTDYRKVVELVNQGASIDRLTLSKLKTDIRSQENRKNRRVTPFDFRYAPEWFYTVYGPADGDFPLMLLEELTKEGGDWERFDGELDVTEQIELATVETLGEQEYYGLKIIVDEVDRLGDEAEIKLAEIEQSIYEEVGYEFNINSNKELQTVLYDRLGVPKREGFKTKTGQMGTGKGVLEQIENIKDEDGNTKFPIVTKLMDYAKVSKEISGFYRALPDLADEYGFINPNYGSLGAATGRISCREPNVQQMHPSVRNYIVPDTDDYYFAVSDFSQVERRLMGGLSGEPAINDRFVADKEADSHKQTYASMYNFPYEQVTGERRDIGKTLNFATAYGTAAQGLALLLYKKADENNLAMAQDLLDTYNRSIPVYRKFVAGVEKKAKERKYSETYFGRRRHIEEFDNKYFMGMSPIARESSGNRAAGNMVVQGTAADILKLAMARLRANWRKYGYDEDMAVMKMNVHDEVTYQVHKTIHPYITAFMLKYSMEVDLSEQGFPPLYIGMNVGHSWDAGGRDDLEAPVILIEEMAEKGREMLRLPLEERPVFDQDAQEFWKNEIINFSARELTSEVQTGYRESEEDDLQPYHSIGDMHKNNRVITYSGYFNEGIGTEDYPTSEGFTWMNNENKLQDRMIIWALILKDKDEFVNKHKDILLGAEPKERILKALNDANVVDKQEVDAETAVILGWFREYGQGLKELDPTKEVNDYEFEPNTCDGGLVIHYTDGTHQTISKGGEYMLMTGGEELEDEYVSPREQLAEAIEFVGNTIQWKMTENDEKILEIVSQLTVDKSVIDAYNIPFEECSSLRVELAGGYVMYIDGWLIPEVKPILVKALLAYYSGLSYDFVEKELNKVADKVFV